MPYASLHNACDPNVKPVISPVVIIVLLYAVLVNSILDGARARLTFFFSFREFISQALAMLTRTTITGSQKGVLPPAHHRAELE